jgi:hypothetical protein
MTTSRQAEIDSKQAGIQAELVSQMAGFGLTLTPGKWWGVLVAQVGETEVSFRVEPFGPAFHHKGFHVQLKVGFSQHRTFKPLKDGGYNWKGIPEAVTQMVAKDNEGKAAAQREQALLAETSKNYQEFLVDQGAQARLHFRPASPTRVELKLTLTYEQANQILPALKAAGLLE